MANHKNGIHTDPMGILPFGKKIDLRFAKEIPSSHPPTKRGVSLGESLAFPFLGPVACPDGSGDGT